MRLSIITGALVALLTGIAIAMQSTMTSRVGSIIGDIRTGILTNTMGGIVAGSLMLFWLLREGPEVWKVPPVVIGLTTLSGLLGVLIVTGISFFLEKVGGQPKFESLLRDFLLDTISPLVGENQLFLPGINIS